MSFSLRIHQDRRRLGLRPKPHWGAYSSLKPPGFTAGGEWSGRGGDGRTWGGEERKGEERGKLGANSALVVGG